MVKWNEALILRTGRPVLEGLDLGRKTIVRSFKSLMSDKANKYWGLNHASHWTCPVPFATVSLDSAEARVVLA